MKWIIFLLLPLFAMAQGRPQTASLFASGQDTILDTGASDTVQYQLIIKGVPSGYYTTSSIITTAEKVAETNEVVSLADDSNWKWAEFVQLKILNGSKSIESSMFYVGDKAGAVTAIIVPDSVNADTLLYTGSVIGGN